MNAVFRRDLRSYFTTPLGYIYLAAFLLTGSLSFLSNNIAQNSSDLAYTFSFVITLLMFTTPLLTMRLFAEEYKQKTDRLLLTAPVRVIDLVLGKFLAAFSIYLLALLLTLVWPLIVASAGVLNQAALISSYLALICAGAAFISIGTCMSALTQNQLVAALSTLGLLLVLYLIDTVTANATSGFLHSANGVVAALSLFRRYDLFARGIFSLSDLVFYLSACALFLFFSARALEKKRWN